MFSWLFSNWAYRWITFFRPGPGVVVAATVLCAGVDVGSAVRAVESGRHLASDENLSSDDN
jgi:hypothetical protein